MDYKDKYIKYKTKYLELKNLNTNNQTGGNKKNNLLFIMFPGNMVVKKEWDTVNYDPKNNRMKKNNFIKEIKKIGDIYFYEPNYYNLYHYSGEQGDDKWFGKDIEFNKDDIDVKKVCQKIYNDVKDFDGKIILLGHSMGAYFVYYFAQKYAHKCLFGIIIDGMFIVGDDKFLGEEKYKRNIEKYNSYTNDDISKLIEKVYDGNKKSIKELSDVYFYNIAKYSKKLERIKKFKIPMISFYNYNTDHKNRINNKAKINDIDHIRKYNNEIDYKIIIFLDKTHFPHLVEESKNIILDNINILIDKYNN